MSRFFKGAMVETQLLLGTCRPRFSLGLVGSHLSSVLHSISSERTSHISSLALPPLRKEEGSGELRIPIRSAVEILQQRHLLECHNYANRRVNGIWTML